MAKSRAGMYPFAVGGESGFQLAEQQCGPQADRNGGIPNFEERGPCERDRHAACQLIKVGFCSFFLVCRRKFLPNGRWFNWVFMEIR